MANWAADWLLSNPDLAGLPLTRHRHGITAALNARERVSHFVGSPAHWQDTNGIWQPLDTALQLIGTEYGAPGLSTRIALNGAVRIDGQNHSHRSTRIGLLTPATMTFASYRTIPNGRVDGDRIIAENGIWSRILTLTENGLREEIVISELPSIPGVRLGDWLVLETRISGSTFPDGWLDDFATSGMHFPAPSARDANHNRADCRRYAKTTGGVQYIYTGIPIAWLADAFYPVTIDPDYAATTADGYVYGNNATYATARSTSSGRDITDVEMCLGQITGYYVDRAFLKFTTSDIPDTDVISQVNLKLVTVRDFSTTDFDVQIVKHDWSAQDPIATANREAAFDGCLAGTADSSIWRNTLSMSTNTQYTSGNLATDWPSKTGSTYYSLRSSLDYAGTAPTGDGFIWLGTQDNTTAGYRPLLAVTHAAAAGQAMLTRARLIDSALLQGRLVR